MSGCLASCCEARKTCRNRQIGLLLVRCPLISLVLRRHGPEKHPPPVHVDPLVGGPAEHVVDVRDDACAGPQLAQQPRLDALVERRTEVERDDSGGAEVRGEEIALDELDEMGYPRGARAGVRFGDDLWIDFDPDTARAVLLR